MEHEEIRSSFKRVLGEADGMHLDKLNQYGLDRYQEQHAMRAMLMVYSDLYRKQLRLWKLCGSAVKNPPDAKKLRDDLLDIINYAAMGIQEIDRLELTKEKNVRSASGT